MEVSPVRYLFPIGRILFALIFITAAPRHFSHEGIQHAADLGTPLAGLLVPISGAMAIAGGLSIALGYKARWGALLLVAFLLPVTFTMHAFWKLHDPAAIHIQQAMFAKNISMIGAALLLTQFGAGPVSIDNRQQPAQG
jgi:putative oxidoreductase